MKKDRRWLWLILVILAAVLAIYLGMRWWNRGVVAVKTAAVKRGMIESVVSASGIVDAPVYSLSSKLGGKVKLLAVREGDRVRAGMTLVEFDDNTRIVAPANGVVGKIDNEEGETASPGMPVIVVVNYDRSWVEAQIDEIDIANVRVGDKVRITSDVYPDRIFEGGIYWIAPLAELRKVGGRVKLDEESYVFPCKVRFLSEHSDLKVNMSVNVDIVVDKKENVLLVPREALVSQNEHSTVFVAKNNRAFQNQIEIGIRSYSSVEALSGVAEGDLVAVSNTSKLKHRGRIKIEK